MPRTPEDIRAYQAAYHAAHREKKITYLRAYRASHRAEGKARDAAYHQKHRAERLAKNRTWHDRHPDARKRHRAAYLAKHKEELKTKRAAAYRKKYVARKRRAAEYYLAHRDKINTKTMAWRKANPQKAAAVDKRHKARKANAPVNDFTAAQWADMKQHYRHCCAYCGRKMQRLEQDHIQPLSRGGSHTMSNIIPACRSCNAHKSAGPPLTQVQPLLL